VGPNRCHTAEILVQRVRRIALDLARRPEVMMEHVRKDMEQERLKNAGCKRAA
jgi:hypothetical protein